MSRIIAEDVTYHPVVDIFPQMDEAGLSYMRLATSPLSAAPVWLISWHHIAMLAQMWHESGMNTLASDP